MEKKDEAIKTNAEAVAAPEEKKVAPDEDLEAKVAQLEAEKAKYIEEGANYKAAYFKEKAKNREDETDEEKFRRIAREELEQSKIMELDRQKDEIIRKALKENKELKLAQLNKTIVPASVGSHSESQPVRDTLVTDEQIAAFKARGWSDKDIERYKRNLQKNAVR